MTISRLPLKPSLERLVGDDDEADLQDVFDNVGDGSLLLDPCNELEGPELEVLNDNPFLVGSEVDMLGVNYE